MKNFLLQIWDNVDSVTMLAVSFMLGNYHEILKDLGIAITIFYTLWKWRIEYFERLKRKNEIKKG